MSDYSLLEYWFDSAGQPVESARDAETGEIVELIGGYEVRRTYVDLSDRNRQLEVPAELSDLEPINTDITKGTWDLWLLGEDRQMRLVTTLEQLLQVLEVDRLPLPEQRQRVGNFLGLPAWEAAPSELKAEVYAWLESTRQE